MMVSKEVLQELYITQNLSSIDIAQQLGISKKQVLKLIKQFDIKKSKSQMYAGRTKKTKNTNLSRYGVCGYNNRTKAITTLRETCGVTNISQLPDVQLKKQQTCQSHFGVPFPSQSDNWKQKIIATNNKKYGYDWFMASPKFWEKVDMTQWLKHQQDTKRKNHTFKTSKIENEYYKYLLTLFSNDDIYRQYKDERYPFACDFYIKSIDTFIELNLHWTHGGMPYDESNPLCQQTLSMWKTKSQTSQYHKNAIQTWTERDVLKQKIAQQNNLNYICIYNKNELYEKRF